jgi:GTP cyclohydrolase I
VTIDKRKIERAVNLYLEAIGEDPRRPGLRETPARVARMSEEILSGYFPPPQPLLKVVDSHDHDEIILVRDIPFYSICEHHLLPFLGKAHVAYIPARSRITGLSKLARVVEHHARQLQTQERLTTRIADTLMTGLKPRGVLVILEAEHLCMTMRGAKKFGSVTVTSVVRGIFRHNPATRSEAMSLIKGVGTPR